MIWNVVGFLGIFLTASQLIPQIIKAFKTKHTNDVSIGLGLIVACNAIVWISYGLHLQDVAIIAANIISFCCAIMLVILKIKLDVPDTFQ